jgi:hypothetical protein
VRGPRALEALADRRHLIVVLRIVTGAGGRLLYGEVVDVRAGPRHRFSGWRGLERALRQWLETETAADRIVEAVIEVGFDESANEPLAGRDPDRPD